MIKLSGSRFTDILPENLASQVETQAFAYAVGKQVEKLIAFSDAARTYALWIPRSRSTICPRGCSVRRR